MEHERRAWAVLIVASAIALAQPASATVSYVSIGVDFPYVVGTAITDTNYAMAGQHTAYATIRITAPSGRYTELTAFQADVVSITALLPIESDDGEFTAMNLSPREWCPWGMVYYFVSSAGPEMVFVAPWVRVVGATVQPEQIQKVNGRATFNAQVMTSVNCAGPVLVAANLAPQKTGMAISWDGPDRLELTLAGNGSRNFEFVARTEPTNTVDGSVLVTGVIAARPSSCDVKTGEGITKTLTVLP
jgi:hypothetical protein